MDPSHRHAEVEVLGISNVATTTIDVQAAIDSLRLTDGRYFIYAVAEHADGKAFTQPISVDVKNSGIHVTSGTN
jgi:hypothetical protein